MRLWKRKSFFFGMEKDEKEREVGSGGTPKSQSEPYDLKTSWRKVSGN